MDEHRVTSKHGIVTLRLGRPWGREDAAAAELAGVRAAVVLEGDPGAEDTTFLRDLPFVEQLSIGPNVDVDPETLASLPNLRSLSVYEAGKGGIPLAQMPMLKELDIGEWNRHTIAAGVVSRSLRVLRIRDRFKEPSLRVLAGLTELSSLEIRHGACESLEGLESLMALASLRLSVMPRLRSIEAVAGHGSLEQLYLDDATRLDAWAALEGAHRVWKLMIDDCPRVGAIDFLAGMPALRLVVLCRVGGKGLDVSPLLRLAPSVVRSLDSEAIARLGLGRPIVPIADLARVLGHAALDITLAQLDSVDVSGERPSSPDGQAH